MLVVWVGYAAVALGANLSGIISKVHEQRPVRVALGSVVVRHLGILFKVASIAWMHIRWYNGCLDSPVQQSLPIDSSKPLVILDIIRPVLLKPNNNSVNRPRVLSRRGEERRIDKMGYLEVSESFCSVSGEQLFDEILGGGVDLCWEVDAAGQNLFVDAEWVVVKERWVSCQHLKDQDA